MLVSEQIFQEFFTIILMKPLVLEKPQLDSTSIESLIDDIIPILRKEPTLVEITGPCIIVGDLHGNVFDLYKILATNKLLPKIKYVFLGDLVDRGEDSVEIIALVYSMKIMFPNHVFIIRGNHETEEMTKKSGFFTEVAVKHHNSQIYSKCLESFDLLPLGAVINNDTFCIHGGLSPSLQYLSQIKSIQRPISIEEIPFVNDLLWSDPDLENMGFNTSKRGIGCMYGEDKVKEFLDHNNLKRMVRGHEYIFEGYRRSFNDQLITVFSASNYCGYLNNYGAVMHISNNSTFFFNEFSISEDIEQKILILPVKIHSAEKFSIVRTATLLPKPLIKLKSRCTGPTIKSNDKCPLCFKGINTNELPGRVGLIRPIVKENNTKRKNRRTNSVEASHVVFPVESL